VTAAAAAAIMGYRVRSRPIIQLLCYDARQLASAMDRNFVRITSFVTDLRRAGMLGVKRSQKSGSKWLKLGYMKFANIIVRIAMKFIAIGLPYHVVPWYLMS